jgi:DNA invertase Pin-like site-specific DNA recombinase
MRLMKAIALTRVSTERQKKLSPMVQLNLIKTWCKARGYELIATFSDVQSGRSKDRDGLEMAVELACAEKAVLVTITMDRLFRSAGYAEEVFKQLDEAGASYATVDGVINTCDNSAAGKLVRGILAMIAQFVSDQSGERVAESNKATVKRLGHRTNGAQPIGWKLGPEGARVRCEEETATVAAVHKANRSLEGCTRRWSRLAAMLNNHNVPTIAVIRARRNNRECRLGSQKWTVSSVRWIALRLYKKKRNRKQRVRK